MIENRFGIKNYFNPHLSIVIKPQAISQVYPKVLKEPPAILQVYPKVLKEPPAILQEYPKIIKEPNHHSPRISEDYKRT